MINTARKAARGLIRDFGEVEHLQVSMKGTSDFVSSADLKTERLLRQELEKARPTFGFLLEEGGEVIGSDPSHRWIIDPIDGTTNFLHGIPHFAISIGLERDGEIIAGVVYEPVHDELYHAEKGGGTFLNDRRLRVSARRKMEESIFATGIPFKGRDGHEDFLETVPKVMNAAAGVRRFGAASLDMAYVSAGRYEGYWESGIKPWDIAAGIILVREAGGYVTDRKGGQDMLGLGSVVAANDQLHRTLLDLVKEKQA
jgi:myo-inositol-1(or 4)-monophosphatase